MNRRPAVLATAFALTLTGCGSSTRQTPDAVQSSSITADVRAPSKTEITGADLNRIKDDTAPRAFLEFWSDLQWQDWVGAVDRYSPGLQRVVGARNLLEALKSQAGVYRGAKPSVRKASQRRGFTVVRFAFADESGNRRLSSTIWRREAGRWRLVFDGLLDDALRSWAQNRTQQLTSPDAAKPTKQALKAGIDASELQGRYLPFILHGTTARSAAAKTG
jgi:hypothetical protein